MKTQTLKRQFRIWTVLLVVIPSLLVMVIYTVAQIKLAKQENLELLSQRVQTQERLIDFWLNEKVLDVQQISQLEDLRSLNEQNIQAALLVVQKNDKNFDSLSYIDKDGFFKISTLNKQIQYSSATNQPYYLAALAGSQYISDVVIGRNSELPIINFSSPVFDYAGNFQGLILGSVKTTTLQQLLRDNWIGKTGEVLLVNRDGVLLTEPRRAKTLMDTGLTEDTAIMKQTICEDALRNIRLGEKGTTTWMNSSGDKLIGAYQGMSQHGWTLIGKISEAEVLAPIYDQLGLMTILTLFLVLLLIPLTTLITNRIKQPLDWLIEQSNLMASDDYTMIDREKKLKDIPYELSLLCDTFTNMKNNIRSNVDLLKENESMLESKMLEIRDINSTLAAEICERQSASEALRQLNVDLENKVYDRTLALSNMNLILQAEIAKKQSVIQELKNSRDAFIISEARYKNLFDHMRNGFASYKVIFDEIGNPIDLKHIRINQPYEKTIGQPASELIGKGLAEIFPHIKEEKFNWLETFIAVALHRESTHFTQYFATQQRWYSISAYSPGKNYVAVIWDDITHYVTLQKEIARMDRLNLIGNMAAGLAHEIRNPMTVIKGYLQHFKQKLPAVFHDRLDLVLNELARIETIITDFLSISKNKPSESELQDLNSIINSIAPLLQTDALKRGMTLELHLAREIPQLTLSEKEIKQLLLNLAVNGLNAMQQHGKLTIETIYQNSSVILSIADCGCGIPKDVQHKIFDPFFTTRDEGTGLGLSVCASIVERHHGIIEIQSKEGNGTCFIITFPIIEE